MASTLVRWDPFAEMASLRSAMDRLFETGFGRLPVRNGGEDLAPVTLGLDAWETDEALELKAAIPGVDPKDVHITVEDGVLSIKGEFEQKDEVNENNVLRRELRYGNFERSLRLPNTVDPEKANATFENGVLRLTLPKKAEARARTITITPQGVVDGEESRPAIESGPQ